MTTPGLKVSRRSFVKAPAAVAALTVVPRHVLDGEKMEVTNDKDANAYVRRQCRQGWTL